MPEERPTAMPFVERVDPAWLDPRLVEQLPVDWARARGTLPVRRDGVVYGLVATTAAAARVDELGLLLGCDVYPLFTSPDELRRAIDECYARRSSPSWKGPAPEASAEQPESGAEDLLRAGDDAPVVQYVNALLLEAVRRRASDVHIEPFEAHLQIRFRIDGFLYDQPPPPKTVEAALIARVKVMARLDIAEKRLPQDGMARVRVGDREFDVRVSIVPVAEGERAVLRLLNQESLFRPLESLGMPPAIEADFRRVLREPHGLVLVTGPTGSGKTTTLYAALQSIDTARLNVMTIEDPIEYQLPRIAQIQVRPKIGLTFAQGLRHILRQDPDVILVGEIRDAETAEIAVRASMTGHLVFSTLHTNDALSAVVRLSDIGVPPYLIAGALRGALAQRLVRRLCPDCREAFLLAPGESAAPGEWGRRLAGRRIYRSRRCEKCLDGYRDRIGVFEWIAMGPDWEPVIRQASDSGQLRRFARERGVRTLLDDALDKVAEGLTSLEEVARALGGFDAPSPA